jgi:hypothetical protein
VTFFSNNHKGLDNGNIVVDGDEGDFMYVLGFHDFHKTAGSGILDVHFERVD